MATKDQLAQELLSALVDVSQSPFTNATAITAVKNSLGLSQNTYRDRVGVTIYGELSPSNTDTTNRYKVLTMAYAVSKTGNSGYDYSGMTKAVRNHPLTCMKYRLILILVNDEIYRIPARPSRINLRLRRAALQSRSIVTTSNQGSQTRRLISSPSSMTLNSARVLR